MALRNDQGIVLRSFPFGEADRVVVILSPNRGKVRAVAKGVRRTKSRFGGRLEPFTHVEVVLYEGRNLDTLTGATTIDSFPALRADLDKVVAAGTMVEVADAVAQEEEGATRLFLLLKRGLKTLEAGPLHADLVPAFLLKAADVVGVSPALTHCAGCGSTDSLTRFSFAAGGAQCDSCRADSSYALRPGLTEYLAGLASSDFDSLPDSDDAMSPDAMGVARRFLEYHLERRLASLAILDG